MQIAKFQKQPFLAACMGSTLEKTIQRRCRTRNAAIGTAGVGTVRIEIGSNIAQIREAFRDMPKQIPFAISYAVNKTAQAVKQAEQSEMRRVFDKPTPWTMNALELKPALAKYADTYAIVKFKGRPGHYLEPHVFGGGRALKAFEKSLQAVGAMPSGTYAVIPQRASWAARIDQYGNLASGLIGQLLSYFQASELSGGHTSNMTKKGRDKLGRFVREDGLTKISGVVYFISNGQGRTRHLHPGIWAKKGTHGSNIAPVLLFVRHVSYKPRFDFFGVAERTVAKELPNNARMAIIHAMATSTFKGKWK